MNGLSLVADQKLDKVLQKEEENEKNVVSRLYERVYTRHLFR